MFSGGRDSTLAALRLHASGFTPKLVTVTTSELYGSDQVRRRLEELDRLDIRFSWMHVRLTDFRADHDRFPDTCFTCQQAYLAAGASLASKCHISHLSLGYSGYQSSWPEQTPIAVSHLRDTLKDFGYVLHLPVYDVDSKQVVKEELKNWGASTKSLEQKCLIQIMAQPLAEEVLSTQVRRWCKELRQYLANPNLLNYSIIREH